MLLSTFHPVWSSCSQGKFCSATKRLYKRWLLWVRTWSFPGFRTDAQCVWQNTRQVSLLHRVMRFWLLWKQPNTSGAAHRKCWKEEMSWCSQRWDEMRRTCDACWWRTGLFCPPVEADVTCVWNCPVLQRSSNEPQCITESQRGLGWKGP